MKRWSVFVLAAGMTATLALPAMAGDSVPAPTVAVTWDMSQAQPIPQQDPPMVNAEWRVAKPGRDATLYVDGPMFGWTVLIDAVWTSDLFVPRKRGATIAHVDLAWTSVQADPNPTSSGSAAQSILVRFTNAKGKWGNWITVARKPLSTPLTSGQVGEQKAAVDILYPGAPLRSKIRAQVKIADSVVHAYVRQTVRVTA